MAIQRPALLQKGGVLDFTALHLWFRGKIGTFFNHNRSVVKFAVDKIAKPETYGANEKYQEKNNNVAFMIFYKFRYFSHFS